MNRRTLFYISMVIFLAVLSFAEICSALPTFPEAEGYGTETVGGRGGYVYRVTNLNDSGPGSLRACMEDDDGRGARMCVFTTGGTITLNSRITVTEPYLTVAGQTAPGGGITLKAEAKIGIWIEESCHDVVIRYITIRNGGSNATSFQSIIVGDINTAKTVYNVVIDHVSASWASDETILIWYDSHDITVSWCLVSEAYYDCGYESPCFGKGIYFGYTGLDDVTAHHNLMAHIYDRGPNVKGGGVNPADIRNNLTYNEYANASLWWDAWGNTYGNYVNNYVKLGPNSASTSDQKKAIRLYNGAYNTYLYVSGTDGNSGFDDVRVDSGINSDWQLNSPISAPSVTTTSAAQAYIDILAEGGAGNSKYVNCSGIWTNRRDTIDTRIVSEVQNGTGQWIDSETDTPEGGWLDISPGTACTDTDLDGMPDVWENSIFGSLTQTATGDYDGDGYTNIEEYFNGDNPPALTAPTNLRFAYE